MEKKLASSSLAVVPAVFRKKGEDGDYQWMIKQAQYDDALFVFTENFLDSMRIDAEAGGGTACIRPFSMYHGADTANVRAVGVPTGWSVETGGFAYFDKAEVRRAIDLAFDRILVLLKTTHAHIRRVIYSADAQDPSIIGTGIFAKTVSSTVVQYISERIRELPRAHTPYIDTSKPLEKIRLEELRLLRIALLLHRDAQLSNRMKRIKKAPNTQPPPAVRPSPTNSLYAYLGIQNESK